MTRKETTLMCSLPLLFALPFTAAAQSDTAGSAAPETVTDIGTGRELFVDQQLVAEARGVEFRMHRPETREVALYTDKPWEGSSCGYITVFEDEGIYRMYYKAFKVKFDESTGERSRSNLRIAYAESVDGVNWSRPNLGLYEFEGSRDNNIVWEGVGNNLIGTHGFTPFKDPNPDAKPEARYKAFGTTIPYSMKLYALQSPDGIHWSLMSKEPILEGHAFDSQNLAFWDPVRKEYRAYVRAFTGGKPGEGLRGIKTTTSDDFMNWREMQWLEYPDAPPTQLYTNGVTVYQRAPHIFLGFPTRYIEDDSPSYAHMADWEHRKMRMQGLRRIGTARTDGLFMASRDGRTFRRWNEAFLRPGPDAAGRWVYGDNYQSVGLIETHTDAHGPGTELSFYATEGYWRGDGTTFRRYTIRLDGFVSAHATLDGGTLTTTPIRFEGDALEINFATSAAGHVRVAILDETGEPIPGFALSDSRAIIGDTTSRLVRWGDSAEVSKLAGRVVRLRFELKDADLYSYRFKRTADQ